MSKARKTALILVVGLALSGASAASGQPLGAYRWQIQPYCNVLTLSVVQQGGLYLLNGTDDECGAPEQASVTGLAFQNPSGSIGLGLTVVATGGASVNLSATLSLATLNGSWRDSGGRTGTFVLTPGAVTGGVARQPPPVGFPVAAASGGDQDVALTTEDVVVRSVTLTVPTFGRVIVNASGYFRFDSAVTAEIARCTITTGTAVDSDRHIIAGESAVAATTFVPFSGTRGITVPSVGPVTINLVCDKIAGSVSVGDTHMTAIFVPSTLMIAMEDPEP